MAGFFSPDKVNSEFNLQLDLQIELIWRSKFNLLSEVILQKFYLILCRSSRS